MRASAHIARPSALFGECYLCIAVLLFVIGCASPRAGLDPDSFPPDLRGRAREIAGVYRDEPRNAAVLYYLAALHAESGNRDSALAVLRRMAAVDAGVQPRARDGFGPLLGDSAFQQIVGEIRRKNPAVKAASPAFALSEVDLVPEGIAWSGTTGRFYLGSIKRKLVSVDRAGHVHDFVAPRAEGLGVVAGVRVDDRHGVLWATSNALGPRRDSGVVTGLFKYALRDGRLLQRIAIDIDSGDVINDLDVAPNGDVFVTLTNAGALLRVAAGAHAAEMFIPPGGLHDPNGIAISGDGGSAFVASWFAIARVDLRTRAVSIIRQPANVASGCLDGIYLLGARTLIGIQNCVHDPGRILSFQLSADLSAIESATVLESYNPQFDGISTGAIANDTVFMIANNQFRAIGTDGRPTKPLNPVQVLGLPLPRRH